MRQISGFRRVDCGALRDAAPCSRQETSVVEAAGAAAVFLLVRVLSGVTASVAAPSRFVAWLLPSGEAGIIRFAVVLVGFYAIRNVVLVAIQFAQERVIQRTASRIAVTLFARFLSAPYAFHFRRSSSSLIHAIRDTVDTAVENVLAAAVHIASACLVVAALLRSRQVAAQTGGGADCDSARGAARS
jgi:ABC-type multidrug transport system fused ATPase/permease subunit